MSEWKAIVGRVSIFPAPSAVPVPTALELFKKVWKSDPTNFQGGRSSLSASIAQGTKEELGLTCSVVPSRIDLTLSSAGREEMADAARLFVVEDGEQLHQELLQIVSAIGQELVGNPVVRVATFLQVVVQKGSWTGTNKILTSILPDPYKVKLNDEEEFILQVARPRKSKRVDSIRLNRVTKWSGDNFQAISLQVPAGVTPLSVSPTGLDVRPTVHSFITASVSFDINNAPVKPDSPLTAQQQADLLLEALEETRTSMLELGIKVEGFANV